MMKENTQKALDYMCKSLMETSANSVEYNHICELKLIELPEAIERWWGYQGEGKYVRVVWSDNPNRDDGYYDICVSGCSAFGVLSSVWKYIDKKL